jgi:Fatty acid desaturase
VLRWLTANIGIHHVHHLCSRIPYYRLPQVLRDYPEFPAAQFADQAREFAVTMAKGPRVVKISIGAFRPLTGNTEPIIDEISEPFRLLSGRGDAPVVMAPARFLLDELG